MQLERLRDRFLIDLCGLQRAFAYLLGGLLDRIGNLFAATVREGYVELVGRRVCGLLLDIFDEPLVRWREQVYSSDEPLASVVLFFSRQRGVLLGLP